MKVSKRFVVAVAVFAAGVLGMATAQAQSSTWNGISGNWSDTTDPGGVWVGGIPADGASNTANFTGVNIAADRTITLDTARTIGNITFTDATTSSNNLLISGANTLTLDRTDATKPTINVTQSGRSLTIGSVIAGNDGLLKSGAGTLVFNASSNNTFTGGFDISGGVVQYDSATNANAWGDAANVVTFTGSATLHNNNDGYTLARSVAVNSGVTATLSGAFNESTNITGAVTGSGNMNIAGGSNGWAVTMSNGSNSLTGTIWVTSNAGQNTSLTVNSFADGADSTKRLKMGATGATADFTLQGSSATPILWTNRGVELAGTTGAISITNNSSNAARTLTISPNLLFTTVSSGAKTLTLGGTNTGVNAFSGNITNNGASATAITKTGAGTWALGGTNTYTGLTNLAASGTTGRLIFQGSQSLSPNTTLVFAQNSSGVQSARFLDDGVGTISFARPIQFGGSNTSQILGIFVGNNNTANGGSSSGTTTGSTIQAGSITFTSTATDTATTSVNVTGANSYRLETGVITLNNLVTRTAGQTTTTLLNPTSANMTVASITMATGNAGIGADGVPVLGLGGTSTDNYVTGVISNASDYLTGQALSLTKSSTSTWILQGTNTYTGTTLVSGGTLRANDNVGLPGASSSGGGSNLNLGGGILSTSANLERAGGSGQTQMRITSGTSGFSANGAAVQVAFGTIASPTALTWGTAPFQPGTLVLNGASATHAIGFLNAVDLNAAVRTIQVDANVATVSGVLSGTGAAGVTKTGSGTLALTNNNSYAGVTTITAGTLEASVMANGSSNSSIGASTNVAANLLLGNGTTFRYVGSSNATTNRGFTVNGTVAGHGATIESSGTGTLSFDNTIAIAYGTNSQTRTLTLAGTNTGANTMGKVIANNGSGATSLTKTGIGTWILDRVNTYSGATNINAGILSINGTGTINSSAVTINGGTFRYNSSTNYSPALTFTNGTLAGTNWNGSLSGLTIGAGQTISPGNSPGTASTGGETWASSGTYVWEINNATGVAGSDPGWDLVSGTGTLDITATSGSRFIIDITSLTLGNVAGQAANFDQSLSYNWLIADFANPVTNFAADKFTLTTTNFQNAFSPGGFSIARGDSVGGGDNTQVYLVYVPEPGTLALLGVGVGVAFAAFRLRKRFLMA